MTPLALYIGGRFTGITVEPDATYAGMWRVRRGGQLSDMANVSRAKDAAEVWAHCDANHRATWKHARHSPAEASPTAPSQRAA
jgi:hypothetical protein